MKKLTYIFLMILTVAACNNLPFGGKNKSNTETDTSNSRENNEETTPKAVVPDDYEVPGELTYFEKDENLIHERIYPIGWSEDGDFAYVSLPPDEACGCLFFDVIIQNMVTDQILWHLKYNDEGEGDNLQSAWWKHKNDIIKNLKENKIIPKNRIKLLNFPYTMNNTTFDKKYDIEYTVDADFGFDVVKQQKLTVIADDTKSKTIFNYTEDDYSMLLHSEVLGFLKSPFEERIAIIMLNKQRGYEGPPHTVHLKFSGCSLTDGFE